MGYRRRKNLKVGGCILIERRKFVKTGTGKNKRKSRKLTAKAMGRNLVLTCINAPELIIKPLRWINCKGVKIARGGEAVAVREDRLGKKHKIE